MSRIGQQRTEQAADLLDQAEAEVARLRDVMRRMAKQLRETPLSLQGNELRAVVRWLEMEAGEPAPPLSEEQVQRIMANARKVIEETEGRTMNIKRPRLTADHRGHLRRMADGWTPFPMQIDKAAQSLERRGLVRFDYDDKGRLVCLITDAGREALETGEK